MVTYHIKSNGVNQEGVLRFTSSAGIEGVSGICYANLDEKVETIINALKKQTTVHWLEYRTMCPNFAIN